MKPPAGKAADVVKELASPDDLLTAARSLAASPRPFPSNTHIHLPPNFSAFQTARHALRLAAAEGLSLLGASNYYDFRIYDDFASAAAESRIFPLFGVEIISLDHSLLSSGAKVNDPDNPGRMYICGKGISRFDPPPPSASRTLQSIREGARLRISRMIDLLNSFSLFRNVPIPLDGRIIAHSIAARCGAPLDSVTLQERHVAQAFQEAFFKLVPENERTTLLESLLGAAPRDLSDPVSVQNDLRAYLLKAGRPAFVEENSVSFEDARSLILDLGGIPCYPVLADGASPLCAFESDVRSLIENLKSRDIHCVEFVPRRNDPSVLELYVPALRSAGLVVTAGTEHNTLEMIPLSPAARGGRALPPAVAAVFREGACVVAAHEFLSLHGRDGFVDASGRPSRAFGDTERLIRAFAAAGRRLIDAASAAHH